MRDFDRALAQADAADAALARGERRPLLGLPMTVKESYNVAGLPTTWGVPAFRDFRPTEDAVAVSRLKAAGAVILGKTNVPPLLADWQADNPIHGRTVNPHDPTRSPGGSSGGGAAALASGMVALELGSDTGGSIRTPAALCGVFGHKPTHGLVPSRGHAFPGTDGAAVELAVCGPLARTAEDLDLALAVVAGPDLDDATGYRLALPPPRAGIAGCRVLALRSHPVAPTDALIRAGIDRASAALRAAGASVADESPLLPDLAAAHAGYMGLLLAIVSRGPKPVPGTISAHDWLGLLDQRERLRRGWRALFKQFDVVIAPAFGSVAFAHLGPATNPAPDTRTLRINGIETPYFDQLGWPGVATYPGLPATAVPVNRSPEGLPVGLQVIGPVLRDRDTIAVAGWLHALTLGADDDGVVRR